MTKYCFASDNASGVHPEILKSISQANQDYVLAYGDDKYTELAKNLFKQLFEKEVDVYFVVNGTAANTLALQNFLRSHQAIICSDQAHLNDYECGSVEATIGSKLLAVSAVNGKLDPESASAALEMLGDTHHVQPKLLTVSQATELGTVYSLEELNAIKQFARGHNLYLHMDGARFANACCALKVRAQDMCDGIDALSFGATKNGGLMCDAIIFFNPDLSREFRYIQKQKLQLVSKSRFVAAQFVALLQNNLWLENAEKANVMASKLSKELMKLPSVEVIYTAEVNLIFARLPLVIINSLQKEYFFHIVDKEAGLVRFVTSFNTEQAHIDGLIRAIKLLIKDFC